jgi:hypothetical protein
MLVAVSAPSNITGQWRPPHPDISNWHLPKVSETEVTQGLNSPSVSLSALALCSPGLLSLEVGSYSSAASLPFDPDQWLEASTAACSHGCETGWCSAYRRRMLIDNLKWLAPVERNERYLLLLSRIGSSAKANGPERRAHRLIIMGGLML